MRSATMPNPATSRTRPVSPSLSPNRYQHRLSHLLSISQPETGYIHATRTPTSNTASIDAATPACTTPTVTPTATRSCAATPALKHVGAATATGTVTVGGAAATRDARVAPDGLWSATLTDPLNQVTTFGYDRLGITAGYSYTGPIASPRPASSR
jgi:hypothetical protein